MMTTSLTRKKLVEELWNAGAIILMCVLGACAYGIVHDLITAHVCLEYFSVAHAPLIRSNSPIVHALFWGVVATWWVGLPLGLMNSLACRLGKANKWDFKMLMRPLIRFLCILLLVAAILGVFGVIMYRLEVVFMPRRFADKIPNHLGFMYNVWSHSASYGFGVLGGLWIHYWILWKRLSGNGQPNTRYDSTRKQG